MGLTPCKGLPSTRKSGGTGKNYDSVNGQGLYVLAENGNIKYVGRGDVYSRLDAHAKTAGKSHLEQFIISENNLTKAEAKYLEQRIMNQYGGAKLTNSLTNLLNKINSYSSKNPNSGMYDVAGHSNAWGADIYNDIMVKIRGFGL